MYPEKCFRGIMVPPDSWGHQFFSILLLCFPVPMYFYTLPFLFSIHNLAKKMMSFHRRFTGGVLAAVCFVMCITLGAAGPLYYPSKK